MGPSSPITEPQLLASTPHIAAMTPSCATEPPASVSTTVGAYPMLQLYASPIISVAQSTHGQLSAAHDPPVFLPSHSIGRPAHRPLQSHLQRPNNMVFTLASHSRLMDSIQLLMATFPPPPATFAAPPAAQVPAQSQHWQASGLPTVGVHSTFQPYAMAPTVTVPVCGQLKVVHLAQADHHFLDQVGTSSCRQASLLN
jgi:hypothetical protein